MHVGGWGRVLRRACTVGLLGLFGLGLTSAVAQTTPKSPDGVYTKEELEQLEPGSPNPYLAFLPAGVEPDRVYWESKRRVVATDQTAVPFPRGTSLINAAETEPNNTVADATFIPSLGTGAGDDSVALLSGSFPTPLPPSLFTPRPEDNGSIPMASVVPIQPGETLAAGAYLGDGPHGSGGSGHGDFDFYRLKNVREGALIEVDIDAALGAFWDPLLTVWDSSGALIALNDDDPREATLDSFLTFVAPEAGDYFIAVGSFQSPFPSNPFDSSSGFGAGSEGGYGIFIGLEGGGKDLDLFSFDAAAGDIIGISADNAAATVALIGPSGDLLVQSSLNASIIYPNSSPLPRVGNALLAYVVSEPGRYAVRYFGPEEGAWSGEIRLFRPPLENAGTTQQVLFLDFDGAVIDTSIFGSGGTLASLSPLSTFLPRWGLEASQEDEVIDAIVASVEENIRLDLIQRGLADTFEIDIRNSRDHADPFGRPNVSRVIIGGTIVESGIFTIGIAQSIDVGNFDRRESALVLLDFLSAPGGDPNSLNSFFRAPGVTKVDIVGTGVGNIVAHEAGHFFGNFHTENAITPPNIMDTGGNLANIVGVGNDFVFGTSDDIDVDFGVDIYDPFELFTGKEDTLNTIAFGLLTSLNFNELYVDLDAFVNGTGAFGSPLNKLGNAVNIANANALIRIFPSSSAETFAGANRVTKPLTIVNESPAGGTVTIGREN